MRSSQLLDAAYNLAQLESLSSRRYADQVRVDVGDAPAATFEALEARDGALREALAAVDAYAVKAMRIRLDHALANDSSVGKPLRTTLAHTVTSYALDLDLLRDRVAGAAARIDPAGAATTALAVVAAARATLEARHLLRAGVLDVARDLAAATIAAATTAARDRYAADDVRLRWLAIRRDLELTVEQPERIAQRPLADRLKALPVVDEVPEDAPELSLGELIEPY